MGETVRHLTKEEREAWRELYNEKRRSLDRTFRLKWGVRSDDDAVYQACDGVQNTFTRGMRSLTSILDVERPSPYLFTIARHEWIDLIRVGNNQISLDQMEEEGVDLPDETQLNIMERSIESREIRDALDEISPDKRTAIYRTFFEGERSGVIADEEGVNPTTVRTRKHRGLKEMEELLGGNPEDWGF